MLYIYRVLINFIFVLSPIIVLARLLKKKEDFKRFKEKFCFFSEKRGKGNLIWFHGASVGEIKSIIPILEKLEKNKIIDKVLITSNTLSSSKIIHQFKFKKVIHQFFPIDTNFLSKKFLNYWRPSISFFIDSEIWPNMFMNLHYQKIPINLINGRITKRSFSRWKFFTKFSKEIFSKFNLCLSASKESKHFLKLLGAKKVKFIGNLKFSESEKQKKLNNKKLKKFLSSKKVWCASSTHYPEEIFCSKIHIELKKKYKNLLTIIIPRHVDRVDSIKSELNKDKLNIHFHNDQGKINKDTDIYIVNSYGNTKLFYNYCQNVFLGGSLITHGGQNPLEAARIGCNILHGPNISNFKEIYNFLKKNKISCKISNQAQLIKILLSLFKKNRNQKKIQKKINLIGKNILQKTYKEINPLLKYEY